MYIPYITKVFGKKSEIESYAFMKREFRKGGNLLLVKKEKEYIAGILHRYKKNRTKLLILGIKDGDSNYIKDGAIGALYYFSFCYSVEKGYTKIHFGGSRPFLKDGVLRYKKKWNQKIFDEGRMGFLIKPLSITEGLKGFFLNNPLIYEDKTDLNGAIFVAGDQSFSKEDFENIYKDYYVRGLTKLVIYKFGVTDRRMQSLVPQEFADRIIMRSAESIF
jgi:hypothetical protein